MSALMPFMRILEQGGKLIQIVKHACRIAGLPDGPVRNPLLKLNNEVETRIGIGIKTLKATM
ncbi:hypothetical protein [Candidatus Spongiihabitans sp.]|uniref:hypothetical protein n=1 Tax=Candidatus Spongiihabitans sp. TaxID=3101308 RepID=UPI003C6FB8A9